ncbi:GATA transcription factor 8-like [Dorcoceras hygrometricum]|uniref:GATA transcription factor n=1 Tax=Dorcoceras hygrometricum TaxID=472368 RepID=A0A2Z7AMX1_9LAMI|nr:GATA transcription factor 8-like [Dorcoceras hygrometricum]
MGPDFADEIDCGNFFDQMDNLIEFPPENECAGGGLVGSSDCQDISSMWNNSLPDSDPLFPGSQTESAADLSAELAVPYEDIIQLEWLSTFVEDSFAGGGMTIGKENSGISKVPPPPHKEFQTSSPVSVLESSSSSSSSSVGKNMPLVGLQRARSKRPRPATFSPRLPIHLISPSTSGEAPRLSVPPRFHADTENFAESLPKPDGSEHKKRKKIKSFLPVDPMDSTHLNTPAQSVRKCLHCEITKTPQWRAGPMGPKTLCNACGVRFKSGRLFPEYRPAASPTYVPALHSNSHKKVVEMRNKVGLGSMRKTSEME